MLSPLLGRCAELKAIRASLTSLTKDSTPVLIIGETGVGRTLLARQIHSHSVYKNLQPETINFHILSERDQRIALLGGGLPELTTTRKSKLEIPTSVFIKHSDLASPFLQEKLALSLQSKKVHRPSSPESHLIRCKPILIFDLPPRTMMDKGILHPSLYNAIKDFQQITLPPLRNRKTDISVLAEYYFHQFYDKLHSLVNGSIEHVPGLGENGDIDPSFCRFLKNQPWEENILQLKAYIRSLILQNSIDAFLEREKIELMKMILQIEEGKEFSLHDSLLIIENQIMERALKKCGGQNVKAAQLLGITERSMRRQ